MPSIIRTPQSRAPGVPPGSLGRAAAWWRTRTSRPGGPGRARGLLPRAALAAAAAAVLLGPALWAAGPAGATTSNPACGPDASASTATSCTYLSTNAEQDFTVPAGVTAVTVIAVGAQGGVPPCGCGGVGPGGYGAKVTATVPLPAGTTTLYVEVGNSGGFNGGGPTYFGGGGGGASDVRTISCGSSCTTNEDPASLASRLVVAGGGGGGAYSNGSCREAGGTAGDTTVSGPGAGSNSDDSCGVTPGYNGGLGGNTGGKGGSGADGKPNGGDGSLGQGGSAIYSGGGGGGGYYGGGAGGDGNNAGGGGAGSSFWAPDATGTPSMTEDTSGTPSVMISYTQPPADLKLTNTPTPDPVTSGQRLTYTLQATNTGGQDATGVQLTDPLPATAVFGSMHTTQGRCTRTVSGQDNNKGGTVTCHLGTLPGGAPATVTIKMIATRPGTLTGTATVTASNVTSDGDDSAPATVTVHGD